METLTPNEPSLKRNTPMQKSQFDPRERKIEPQNNLVTKLSVTTLVLGLITLSVIVLFSQYQWAIVLSACATLGSILVLLWIQRNALKTRAAAFGFHSALISILALLLLGAINFFTHKHPKKFDLTKEGTNSLSDQSIKTIKGLETPIKATYFAANQEQEPAKRILRLYRDVDAEKFKTDFVNPFLEQQRTKAAGVLRPKTLVLESASGRTVKVEDLTEEKITNAIIKITKTKNIQICSTSGHGEFGLDKQTPDSLGLVNQSLLEQSYLTKTVSIAQDGKIPTDCQVVIIPGIQNNFTSNEIKALDAYLNSGGALLVSLGIGPKGREPSPELNALLKQWGIQVGAGLVVDPQFALQSPEFPGAAIYDANHPITKNAPGQTFHPLARPLTVISPAPPGIKVTPLAKSGPLSYAETDLASTTPSRFDQAKDQRGPLPLVVSAEGKKEGSSATKSTRIVVFGSSLAATKQFTQLLSSNLDFYLNAIAWVADDDSAISIRPKDTGPGNFVLSKQMASVFRLVTLVLLPLLFAVTGAGIWWIRRRL